MLKVTINIGGSPRFLQLISKDKIKDLKKCIIYQNSKDKKEDSKLTSTKMASECLYKKY